MGFKYTVLISILITLQISSRTLGVTINVHNIKAKDLVTETEPIETKAESEPLPNRNFRSEFTDFELDQMEGIYPGYMEIPADDPRFATYLIQAAREPIPTTPKPPPSPPSFLSQYNLHPQFGIVVKNDTVNGTTTTETPFNESDEEDEEELDDEPRLEGVYTAMEKEKRQRERLMNDLDEGSDEDYQEDDEEYEYPNY